MSETASHPYRTAGKIIVGHYITYLISAMKPLQANTFSFELIIPLIVMQTRFCLRSIKQTKSWTLQKSVSETSQIGRTEQGSIVQFIVDYRFKRKRKILPVLN
jgi:hypothetical protein